MPLGSFRGLVFKRTQEKRAIALKRRSNDGGTAVSRQFFSFSAKVDNFEPFEAKLFFLIKIYTKALFWQTIKNCIIWQEKATKKSE